MESPKQNVESTLCIMRRKTFVVEIVHPNGGGNVLFNDAVNTFYLRLFYFIIKCSYI